MKRLLLSMVLCTVSMCTIGYAQAESAAPATVAIFPFKNLYGYVAHDSLSWQYADSLYAWLSAHEGSGVKYALVPMDDIRDQMLAQNVDVKSPSYETDVWKIAKALGARLVVWGTYLVKYEKSNIEVKVFDVKTLLPDPTNFARGIRVPFAQSLETVANVGESIVGGLR